MASNAAVLIDLMDQVNLRKGPPSGTVIIFEWCFDLAPKKRDRMHYTYVAIFISGRWYLSGLDWGSVLQQRMTHEALMSALATKNCKEARLVTETERFKP